MTNPRYVRMPIELPAEVTKDFLITHREGATGHEAWKLLIEACGRAVLNPADKGLEESIVRIKDVHGEPAIVFPDTPKKEVVLLLSHLSKHVTEHPMAVACMIKAVAAWKALKTTGHT
jgi:hypothetical protein